MDGDEQQVTCSFLLEYMQSFRNWERRAEGQELLVQIWIWLWSDQERLSVVLWRTTSRNHQLCRLLWTNSGASSAAQTSGWLLLWWLMNSLGKAMNEVNCVGGYNLSLIGISLKQDVGIEDVCWTFAALFLCLCSILVQQNLWLLLALPPPAGGMSDISTLKWRAASSRSSPASTPAYLWNHFGCCDWKQWCENSGWTGTMEPRAQRHTSWDQRWRRCRIPIWTQSWGGVISIGCCRETVCVVQEQQRSPFIRSHIKAMMEYIQFPGGGSGAPSEPSSWPSLWAFNRTDLLILTKKMTSEPNDTVHDE